LRSASGPPGRSQRSASTSRNRQPQGATTCLPRIDSSQFGLREQPKTTDPGSGSYGSRTGGAADQPAMREQQEDRAGEGADGGPYACPLVRPSARAQWRTAEPTSSLTRLDWRHRPARGDGANHGGVAECGKYDRQKTTSRALSRRRRRRRVGSFHAWKDSPGEPSHPSWALLRGVRLLVGEGEGRAGLDLCERGAQRVRIEVFEAGWERRSRSMRAMSAGSAGSKLERPVLVSTLAGT